MRVQVVVRLDNSRSNCSKRKRFAHFASTQAVEPVNPYLDSFSFRKSYFLRKKEETLVTGTAEGEELVGI